MSSAQKRLCQRPGQCPVPLSTQMYSVRQQPDGQCPGVEKPKASLRGQFPVQYKYVWYETKNITRKFDFVYRLIIDGVATEALEPDDVHSEYDPAEDARIYTFYVTIPANKTGHLRPILIEASTHIDMVDEVEDYWTEWFPVISTVQMY